MPPVAPLITVPPAAAVVVAALLAHRLPALPDPRVSLAVAVAGLLGFLLAWRAGRHGGCLAALLVAAAGWTMQVAAHRLAERIDPGVEGRDFVVVGRVASMPLAAERGSRFAFDVERCESDPPDCPRARRLRLSWASFGPAGDARHEAVPAPWPGERWRLNVRLKRPHALHNPGTFDAELRALEEGVAAAGYVAAPRAATWRNERLAPNGWRSPAVAIEAARAALRAAMREALRDAREDVAGVLVALAVGDQAAIPTRSWEIFNRTGVGHLMSISGLHVTMLAGLSVLAARRALRTRAAAASGLLLRWPAARMAWLVGVTTAFLYSGLAGWGIPAQRTCWMVAVAGFALAFGRTRSTAHVLALAAAVVTLLDPWAPLAAGFWLSFAAVGAITLHGSATRLRAAASGAPTRPGRLARVRALLREAVGTQWAATLALLPLGALFFSSVSLVGPLANAFAIPLVSGLITPLALLAAGLAPVSPWLGGMLLVPAATLTAWMLDLLAWLAALPWAIAVLAEPGAVALALAALAVALLLWPVPVPARGAALAGLLPLLAARTPLAPPGGLRVTALDVGQGMSVLVETSQRRLLYDTGPAYGGDSEAGARVIVPWLRARGIDRLDALVVSHLDSDHSGGAPSVLRNLRIDWIAGSLPAGHPAREAGAPFRECRRGETWRWGEVRFEFLHPGPEPARGAKSPSNASSCVLLVEAPAARVLLTGDIEAAQERALVARLGAAGLRADLMLAPHHGSATSSSTEFLQAVAPSFVVAQLGYRNRFGHPAPRVAQRYRAAGIPLLRSDRDGAVVLEFAPGRAPRLERSRVDDRRYWRVRLADDLAAADVATDAAAPTAPSSRRRPPRPRRAPAPPLPSTGTP